MVNDDRGRALFGDELEGGRQLHPELPLGGKDLEERHMVLEIRAGAVAPRVALAPPAGNAELSPHSPVQPLRQRFRGFHGEPVRVKRLGIFASALQLLEAARCLVADRHDLEADDVDVSRVHGAEVVCDAKPFATFLPRKVKARDLARRAVSRVSLRIVDDEIVPVRLRGKETVDSLRLQPAVALRFAREARQRRLELALHGGVVLRTRAARTPLQAIQLVEIEEREQLVERDIRRAAQRAHTVERRHRYGMVLRHVAPRARLIPHRDVFSHRGAKEGVGAGVVEELGYKCVATRHILVLQDVHRVEPLEGVLAVKDTRLVGTLAVDEQRTPSEAAVDRGAADQHRNVETALVQLLHAQRHLLRRRDEERREPDCVGLHLERLLDDRVHRHLLAEIEHRVAVVGQNRVDE